MTFDAIVLAGGSSARFGGRDKALVEINGMTLLERAVNATAGARNVIIVGPERAVERDVSWVTEDPPGSGPAAALAAGLAVITSDVVAVLAVDMPLMTRAVVELLVESVAARDGACLVGDDGRVQYLAAAYRSRALRQAAVGNLQGSSVRALLESLDVIGVLDRDASLDCDTPGAASRIAVIEKARHAERKARGV
ncbi:MAG: molybdenum cofactor guanylyltransferase [Actinomycetota bacterium]|nr:molybdenum cofactor guanylyltransferase [Actinomycetota bacterium]